jgi:D-alanine-D-alanine ligase
MPVKPRSANAQDSHQPPGGRPQWLVAVIANIKSETNLPQDAPPDAGAEFDRLETIESIRAALESGGHRTTFLSADMDLPINLRALKPDICFNIAEGLYGDGREAQVPALLELLRIPYTASRVVANAISLDKTVTKRIWRDAQLPVVPFQEFSSGTEALRSTLHYPLFVKPAREGTGMGVDLEAVVENEADLRKRVAWVLSTYRQPALVEHFLPGREFTVGILGARAVKSFSQRPNLYDSDGFHQFPILEIESQQSITPGVYGYKAKSKDLTEAGAPGYLCPAQLDLALAERLQRLALRAHRAIGAVDVSRVDFRLDADGNPYLLEINTLPGLNPEISDLCIMAAAENLPYNDLILEILDLAAFRFGLLTT